MKIKELKANKRNPRKITQDQALGLKASLERFGDLGSVIWNMRTRQLVGGHQRVKQLPQDAIIKIEHKYDPPTKTGTVAEGYICVGDERFSYRQVDWDETTEIEALLAANKHGGSWDDDLLKITFADFPQMDLKIAGFAAPKFNATPEVAPLPQAPEVTHEEEESDEEYVKNTPQTTEQIPTESPNGVGAFDKVEEKMDVVGKRFVIIIDCKDQGMKDELKEKIRSLVTESGANFF